MKGAKELRGIVDTQVNSMLFELLLLTLRKQYVNHHYFWNIGVKYNANLSKLQENNRTPGYRYFCLLCSLWNLIYPSGQSSLVIASKYVIFLSTVLTLFSSGPHSFHHGGSGFHYSVFSQKCPPAMFFFLLHLTSFFIFRNSEHCRLSESDVYANLYNITWHSFYPHYNYNRKFHITSKHFQTTK